MKYRKSLALTSVALVASFVLAACAGGTTVDPTTAAQVVGQGDQQQQTTPAATTPEAPSQDNIIRDPFGVLYSQLERHNLVQIFDNPNPIIDGGILRWGWGSTGTFTGLFCTMHSEAAMDSDIRALWWSPLLRAGWDLNVSNAPGNLAHAHFDREAQTVTIVKMHESTWHDGVPRTLDDLRFALYTISHPDYVGIRFNSPQFTNLVGAQAFNRGEADYISGITISDDFMTLTMEFTAFPPTMPAFGFWSTDAPRHHWEGIAVADMREHPRARHEVLGNGPFILDNIVPGESVSVIRNENYWQGRPHLAGVTMEIIDPMMLPMAMQQGLFDIGSPFAQSQFTEDFRYMTNVQFLANPFAANSAFFFSFRVGGWDDANGRVATDAQPWRLSETVRIAMALSKDHVTAGELFNGLVVPAGSIYFAPRRIDWVDRSIPTNNHFDPVAAMAMLDAAGYIDIDGDGFREFPDGSPMIITHLAASGSAANELNRQLELQNWHDVGLNVVLYQGRLVEGAVVTDVLSNDSDGRVVDSFNMGWAFGASPNPYGIFGPTARFNRARYESERFNELFERFESDDMWDEDFMAAVIQDWQEAFYETYLFFPTTTAIGLSAVNRRVANFSLEITGDGSVVSSWNWWLMGLTSDTPYVDGQ